MVLASRVILISCSNNDSKYLITVNPSRVAQSKSWTLGSSTRNRSRDSIFGKNTKMAILPHITGAILVVCGVAGIVTQVIPIFHFLIT